VCHRSCVPIIEAAPPCRSSLVQQGRAAGGAGRRGAVPPYPFNSTALGSAGDIRSSLRQPMNLGQTLERDRNASSMRFPINGPTLTLVS